MTSFVNQKSPPSSGSSLETNSPRSAASQTGANANAITTINSSSSSGSPHPVHQAQSNFPTSVNTTNIIGNIGNANQPTTNLLNNSLGAVGKVLSDLVSSDTRSAAIQELRETVYRKVSTRFRSSSTSSSSTSSSCSLSNNPSIDTHPTHIYHASPNNNNLIQNIHNVPLQQSSQSMYHYDQTAMQQPLTDTTATRVGRQLPHIPGQQTYYQFHSQLSQQQQNIMMNDPHSLESSPSPKTPLNLASQRVNQSKFANALNSNAATAFRFPPNLTNSPPIAQSSANAIILQQKQQQPPPPHSPLKNQSSDEYPCSSTTMSSHRSRSSSSDIYEEQPTSPIPPSTAHNVIHPTNLSRHNTLQTNLRTDCARNRRVSPLSRQRAIHVDAEQQQQQSHFNQMSTPMQQDEHLILQQSDNGASVGCSPLHQAPAFSLTASSVKTQRSNLGFPPTKPLQQAKSFTMLQQSSGQQQFTGAASKQQSDDGQFRWNWRENRVAASSGLFRCKSACETNTASSLNRNEDEEATIEPRTGCVFRKMTIKKKERSYCALDVNHIEQQQANQVRKLSFNPELTTDQRNTNASSPMTSAQQIANFFKEPVHKSHSEGRCPHSKRCCRLDATLHVH